MNKKIITVIFCIVIALFSINPITPMSPVRYEQSIPDSTVKKTEHKKQYEDFKLQIKEQQKALDSLLVKDTTKIK